jgi:hypothetical protein
MLASIFIMQGLDNLRRPERVAPLVEPMVRTLSEQVPALAFTSSKTCRYSAAC